VSIKLKKCQESTSDQVMSLSNFNKSNTMLKNANAAKGNRKL